MAGRKRSERNDNPKNAPISGVVDLHPKRPPIDWDEAVRLYVEDKLSFAEVARRTSYSVKHVRDGLLERGVEPRPRGALADAASARLRNQWQSMRRRCLDPTRSGYAHYGARGIIVCGEWDDFRAFSKWAIAHGFEPGLSIVLKDRNGDFSPENCEIVSREEEIARRHRDFSPPPRRVIEAFGERKGAVAWSKDPRCRVPYPTLKDRLAKGVFAEIAITVPPGSGRDLPRSKPAGPRIATRRPLDWAEARRLYEVERCSLDEIAARLESTPSTIRAWFRRNGVELRPRSFRGTTTGESKALYLVWAAHLQRSRTRRDVASAENGEAELDLAWPDYKSFREWALAAGWKPGLCVVRVDDSKPYSDENCRIVTRQEMARTRRPASRPPEPLVMVTAFGESKGLAAWARDPRCRVTFSTLRKRLKGGARPEDAISEEPKVNAISGRYGRMLEAFGETKSLTQWSKDQRCKLTLVGLWERLARGMSMEEALTEKPFRGYELDSPNRNPRNSRSCD